TLATNVSSTASVVQPTTLSGNISKERFNYASFDCGAIMLAHNREASSANAILHNNKDAYMLNKCSAKRFIIIEMCEDILVEVIMLANFEFFSSMFKDFEVSVADRYPPKGDEWTSLGQFRAKNVRDYQYFKVPNPKIWTRYLKVSFLSDYGHEYYCPLTLLRVYGTTMMEEMKIEDEASGTLMGISKTKPFTYIKEQFYSMMSSEPENQYSEGAPSSRASGTPQSSNDGEDIRSDETADTSSSPPATGGTQESIFKQILKRLSLLERNSTMSYIYLEEQSKLLNDIFSHAGFREQERFDALLHHYNRTLLN
ncbi:UNC-like C-terminal-domain-containing protein, partial [Phlyctochytrium arcticum]